MGIRRKVISALVVLAIAVFGAPAIAQTNPGLGTSWPNAQDLSPSTQYHVYRWVQGGVTYVQVNDAAGNIQFAVGAVNGAVFVLPIGTPSSVQVSQQPVATGTSSSSTSTSTLYSDSTVTVQQTPSSFVAKPSAQMICKDPTDCTN